MIVIDSVFAETVSSINTLKLHVNLGHLIQNVDYCFVQKLSGAIP